MWIETVTAAVASVGSIVVIAAGLQTVAYLFSSQLMLRFFLLMGTAAYMLYYFVAADEPLWHAIFGTACIGITSIYGFLRVLADRSTLSIPKAYKPIFDQIGNIEPGAFRKLMKTAHIKTFDAAELLIEKGTVPEHVFFTVEGNVDVSKRAHSFAVGPHNFLGEISIMGGFPATATVHSRAGCTCVIWHRETLLTQMRKNERFRSAVEALFAKDMARKLAEAVQVT